MNKLLILDIDETLVYATESKLDIAEDFQAWKYFIYKRPYLNEFLEEVSKYYKLAIWSSASDDYVKIVSKNIIPTNINLEFVWSKSRCTTKRELELDKFYNLKNLKKVKNKWFSLENIIIVENTPIKVNQNYGNAIYVKDFKWQEDSQLKSLSKYLINIYSTPNFRKIEKRNWRSQI